MRCGRCKAEVMLGSAQCAKCGASVLDATLPDQPRPNPSMIGTAWVPPPSGAMDPNIGRAGVAVPTLPPPPPPDNAPRGAPPPPPPPAQHRPPIRIERARRAAPAGQAAKAKIGCGGCLGPLVAVAIVGVVIASAGRSVVDDVGDALDSGERVDGPAVVLGEPIGFEIGSDDTGVHALLATIGGPATVSVDAVGDFDPRVRVVEVGGAELGSDDDGGEDRDSLLSVVLDEGRSYEVEVEEFSGDAGEYVLLVTSAVTDGASVGRASQVDGSVAAGETARHPFTGPGGELTVRVLGRDGFDPFLTIRDGAGNELGTNDDADGRDSRLTLAVPLDVAVFIEVKGFNDAAGAYTVVVE